MQEPSRDWAIHALPILCLLYPSGAGDSQSHIRSHWHQCICCPWFRTNAMQKSVIWGHRFSKVPVRVTNCLFLVIPVGRIVLSLKILLLPIVAIDGNTWLPEFHVLMDMSSVSATTFHLHCDNTMDINLPVTSLGGNPVRWVLATDVSTKDGTFKIPKLKKVNKFKMMGDEEEAK